MLIKKYLIPEKGLRVLDPVSYTPLPKGGGLKEWTGPRGRYWRRRVRDGSCTISEQPSNTSKKNVALKRDNRKEKENN